MTEHSEMLALANAELAWWQDVFSSTGYTVVGWSGRYSVQVRDASGTYITFDSKQVKVIQTLRSTTSTVTAGMDREAAPDPSPR